MCQTAAFQNNLSLNISAFWLIRQVCAVSILRTVPEKTKWTQCEKPHKYSKVRVTAEMGLFLCLHYIFILPLVGVPACLSPPSLLLPPAFSNNFFLFLNHHFSNRALLFVCFQINILLNFSAGEDCPCPEDIQDELNCFHDELRLHCGKVQYTAFQIYVLCSLTL